MIDGHGDDIYRYGARVKYNFSSNICRVDYLDKLMQHIALHPEVMGSYPEPYPGELEAMIAATEGVPAECVIVTNGATEAIYLIAHAFQNEGSDILSPTFSEYEDACRMYGHKIHHAARIDEISVDAGVVWLCNPNNPTGKVLPADTVQGLAGIHCDKIFVIDGAYADYAVKPVMTPRTAVDTGNVVLLGSFTKRYSVPGLRIGYAIADSAILDKIRQYRMPWSVNAIAIAAARYLMTDTGTPTVDASRLHEEALRLRGELMECGMWVSETDCNFMLCRLPCGSAPELKEWLVERYGILIRDASNFHGLDNRYIRVAAQSREDNKLLIKAIREWMSF